MKPKFGKGNTKLGENIWTWSIPSVVTCIGATLLCIHHCYARLLEARRKHVLRRCQDNLAASREEGFVAAACQALRLCRLLRLHVHGDFADVEYTRRWLEIMRRCPWVTFLFYTRSWRDEEIRRVLVKMSRLRNVRSWWSVDRETGWPEKLPRRTRIAYMQVAEDDLPQEQPGVVFRVHKLRRLVQLRVCGARVCPAEDGRKRTKEVTCESCGICLREPGKISLPLVVC